MGKICHHKFLVSQPQLLSRKKLSLVSGTLSTGDHLFTGGMELIHQTAAGANSFKTTNDIDSVSLEDVLLKVEPPMPVSSSRCLMVKRTNEDFDRIEEAFNEYVTI